MRSFTLRIALLFLMLSGLCAFSNAEVRSGYWTLVQPSSYRDSAFDFSDLTPFCASQDYIPWCPTQTQFDGYFTNDSIIAPNGVCFDSSMSVQTQSYLKGKVINRDQEGLFYLDSMIKQCRLQAPQGVYRRSIPSRKDAYFIKTNEDQYAVFIKTGEYIGAYNRTYYYWAYQPDAGAILYKSNLIDQPDSIAITPDVFSGRPANPTFILTDSAGIADITRQLFLSINTLLDPSVEKAAAEQCGGIGNLGQMTIMTKLVPEYPFTIFKICDGLIIYGYTKPNIQAIMWKYFYDKNSSLEKLIYRIGYKNNLVATDSFGTVRFRDITPDSLKEGVAIRSDDNGGPRLNNGFISLKITPTEITYRVNEAGRVRIDLFNLSGKYVSLLADHYQEAGVYSTNFQRRSFSPGVYILRCSRPGTRDRDIFFPLGIGLMH